MGKALKLAQLVNTIDFGGILDDYMCSTPNIVSVSASTINERSYVDVVIDNYDNNAEYVANIPLVTKVYYIGYSTFRIYVGNVTEDTDIEIKIRALKTGFISSRWSSSIFLKVLALPEIEDDVIINNAFLDNKDTASDCDVSNSAVKITSDNGEYYEKTVEQGSDETEWVGYKTTVTTPIENLLVYSADTTKEVLSVLNKNVQSESKCYIVNDEYTDGVVIELGDIEDKSVDTVSTLDVFSDGKCTNCYNFNNDLKDLSDNANGTWSGSEEYSDSGKYDACAKFTGSNYIKMDGVDFANIKAFSFWIYPVNTSDQQGLISFDGIDLYLYHDPKGILAMNNDGTFITTDGSLETNTFSLVTVNLKDYKVWVNKDVVCDDGTNVDVSSASKFGVGVDYDDGDATDKIKSGTLIDQLRIYNNTLTDDDVKTIYSERFDKFDVDISSNELASSPTEAYILERPFEIKSALQNSTPTEDDYITNELESWKIESGSKLITYKKQENYAGSKFKRMFTGLKNAVISKLETQMWKEN